MQERGVGDLPLLVSELPDADRQLVARLLLVTAAEGTCRVPRGMQRWVEQQFGSVAAVERQTIVRVTNRYTLEGAQFNPLRAMRPMARAAVVPNEEIEGSWGDAFCDPESQTPADEFGRVAGAHCVTASNVAKCEGAHGVLISCRHDPLAFTGEQIADYLDVALEWIRRSHVRDREAAYPLFMWNCLWRAGASVVHGHAQVMLTRGMHFPRIEQWRRAGCLYRDRYGTALHDDLVVVHDALGLGWREGSVAGMAYLTPTKEKEVVLIASACDGSLAKALATVLGSYADDMGVRSFNVAVWLPPCEPQTEDWTGFPVIARVVDRGHLGSRVSDMGAMELYAASVVASDPFEVAPLVRARALGST